MTKQLLLGLMLCWPLYIYAGEITFELPDNERMCFYEEIEKGTKSTLEFQVCCAVVASTLFTSTLY